MNTASGTLERISQYRKFSKTHAVPRRMPIPSLSPTDQMYNIKKAAFAQQGFTPGISAPQVLHDQRIWYDKNAPSWGAGNKIISFVK